MKNADYWKERSEAVEKQLHKQSEEYYKEVEKQFIMAEKSISEDIEKWYARLAVNNDISLAEAREFLDKSGLAEFQWTVEEYIRHGKENGVSKNWEKELENASAQWHIRKLEAIQLQMQHHLEVLYAGLATGMVEHLSNIYKDAYYRKVYSIQQGLEVGATVTKLDNRRVEKALQHCWAMDGKIFSDRIWQNKQMLTNELNTILTQSIIRGENPGNYITALSKKMKTSRNNASRIIYTESAAIAAQADKDCYKELGIEEFEFLATLDSHTSKICREMDGRHFPMSEYKIGVNVPPLHPFCRSTTCPYFNDEFTIGEERAARGEDGKVNYVPADMTYEEWYEEYVEKPAKNGTMVLERNAQRKEQNNGAFGNLEITMQKRKVKEIAEKYGIDLSGITIKIQRSESMLGIPMTGSTDYKNIGRIDLFPNAFKNEEELVRTLIHEKCHVKQLQKHGVKYVQENLNAMEKEAYAFEEFWYKYLKKKVK